MTSFNSVNSNVMSKHEREYNLHHLIPVSKMGLDTDENLLRMPVNEHRNLHRYFDNSTPVEQICKVLLLNNQIWTDNFKADLLAVLDNYINNYYIKHTHSWYIKSEIQKVLELQC